MLEHGPVRLTEVSSGYSGTNVSLYIGQSYGRYDRENLAKIINFLLFLYLPLESIEVGSCSARFMPDESAQTG